MEQNEKIIQISGAGEMLYALSSEGKLYVGIHHDSGFEWKKMPPMNFEKMGTVVAMTSRDDQETQIVFAASTTEEIKTATIIRDEVKEPEPPAAPAATPAATVTPTTPTKK